MVQFNDVPIREAYGDGAVAFFKAAHESYCVQNGDGFLKTKAKEISLLWDQKFGIAAWNKALSFITLSGRVNTEEQGIEVLNEWIAKYSDLPELDPFQPRDY